MLDSQLKSLAKENDLLKGHVDRCRMIPMPSSIRLVKSSTTPALAR
jgi:hypothetical protein